MALEEREYVEECPACGARFLGMTPDEFRDTHAAEDCPKAPFASLYYFPTEEERERLRREGKV